MPPGSATGEPRARIDRRMLPGTGSGRLARRRRNVGMRGESIPPLVA
jgi:hypothetical protein